MQNPTTVLNSNSYSKFKKSIHTLAMFTGLVCASVACALPELDKVVTGDVKIAQKDTNTLQINQASDKAIVNWQKFNIDAKEKVNFQQPVNGVCLNRVDATNGMSHIAGQLNANATVLLINGSGILFADSARVNVGGLVASASDISEENFKNDRPEFNATVANGAIVNHGKISVKEAAILFGTNVVNDGQITSKTGLIVLGAGKKLNFDHNGDGMLNFVVEPSDVIGSAENKSLTRGIDISGKVVNESGPVLVIANGVQGVYDNLINVSGEVRAVSVEQLPGAIVLLGGDIPESKVNVSGKLDASSATAGVNGGFIQVFGSNVEIANRAELNVTGKNGGAIMVGLPQRIETKGPKMNLVVPATETLKVDSGVMMNASAMNAGNAGAVVLGSANELICDATIKARAGAESGNGGNIILNVNKQPTLNASKIDVSAPHGIQGKIINSLDVVVLDEKSATNT